MKQYQKSLFIFRRDLRLEDNTGLLKACEVSEEVIPLFIFDPRQYDAKKNDYFSARGFSFLLDSLEELDEALKKRGSRLYVAKGVQEEIVGSLVSKNAIEGVFFNIDYTPFAQKRDARIKKIVEKEGASCTALNDLSLVPVEEIETNEGKSYSVFTPFMKKAMERDVPTPERNNFKNFFNGKLEGENTSLKEFIKKYRGDQMTGGGREEALSILRDLSFLKEYAYDRNIPSERGTSKLSPHLKYGTVSVREVYHDARKEVSTSHQFISELYWRDFYLHVSYSFPHVFKKSFLPWADEIRWRNNKKEFDAWKQGMTGVPIVDAGMRELLETGWMHNRARMIVASFLTKNLLIDWRWGEQFFAQELVDYDPSSNNGGWQWSASVGADPRPLRIFNPYTQAEKYDPDGVYIKKWVPELKDVDTALLTNGKEIDFSEYAPYPKPIASQKESYHRAREVYKQAKDDYKG